MVDAAVLLAEVVRIAPSLHKAGTFSARTFEALLRHASAKPIKHSLETGSGASTLLFSHLSEEHAVFALDAGTDSIRAIEHLPLLRKEVVTFVEGPTQQTLPAYGFPHRLQLALIDGPHGYPFPDLEYFYIYPHLDVDALLIVDDIHIPTITNLFEFLSVDQMFELQEVVETTAFFRRTSAPTFSTVGDGWWLQQYNQRAFESRAPERVEGAPFARVESATPFYLDRLGAVEDPARVENPEVRCDEELVLSGWALDAASKRAAAAVDIVIDGVSYRTSVRVPRADVAAFYGDQAYFRCGFNASFAKGFLKPGWHELELRIILRGERDYHSAVHIRFRAR